MNPGFMCFVILILLLAATEFDAYIKRTDNKNRKKQNKSKTRLP
jgi:hypothetical protein